ncbi:MAG: hypothetical protein ABII64_07120 [Elusimicrobiota bacterium]
MKKIILSAFFLVLSQNLSASENYQYFTEAQSLKGSTGYIHTFSTRVMPKNMVSFGLHRFICGINYGFFRDFEAGLNFNLKEISSMPAFDQPNIERKMDEVFLTSKLRILREEEHPLDVSLGTHRDTIYLAGGKFFRNFHSITAQGGVAWNRRETETFFAITESLTWQQAILEFEPEKNICNLGWRFLLSPEMKLDLFLQDFTHISNVMFNNFIFGITIVV